MSNVLSSSVLAGALHTVHPGPIPTHVTHPAFLSGGPKRGIRMIVRLSNFIAGLFILLRRPEPRTERGLSQSAENAILLAGAVAVATVVIGAITVYVTARMPK